ncbi:MAG: uroporphyrinogen-III synthase [Actinomycetota bacterium]|jgi:uroporphyrinogen-III synthase|nr:uroporphyrinogen-III synthase [Actinomycetota bacterium]
MPYGNGHETPAWQKVGVPVARSLVGFTVGITADRRAAEQGELLERRGASVVYGPSIVTEYLSDDEGLFRATEALIASPPDVVVANTAIGMRAWIESASAWGLDRALLSALAGATIAARGPKAASACVAAGLTVGFQAAGERLDELVAPLAALPSGLAGRRVAVQLHGSDADDFVGALSSMGAEVVPVTIYRYRRPDDDQAAIRLIEAACDGRVQAVTFTSKPSLANLFAIASNAGLDSALLESFSSGVIAACIGPVCAEGARAAGVRSPLYPATGRIGLLVRLIADELAGRRQVSNVDGVEVSLQGVVVRVGEGDGVTLTPREASLLSVLLDQPGSVVPRPVLMARVWGSAAGDPHVLDVTVARLRRRLSGLRLAVAAVPRRGYRLALGPGPGGVSR